MKCCVSKQRGNVLSTPNSSKSVYFVFDNFCFIFSIIFFLFILFFLFSSFYQFYRCIAYNTLDWMRISTVMAFNIPLKYIKKKFFLVWKSYNCLSYRAWCFYYISAEEFLLEFISVFWWSDYSSRISYHTNRMMCSTNIKHVTHVIVFNSFFYCCMCVHNKIGEQDINEIESIMENCEWLFHCLNLLFRAKVSYPYKYILYFIYIKHSKYDVIKNLFMSL